MAGFDVSALAQEETITVPLVHPATGEEIGVTATVYGQDSAKYKEETATVGDKCADWQRKHPRKTLPNSLYANWDKQKVINCTKSVEGLSENGKPLADIADIFERFPFFYEQVVAAMTDRSLFIKGSSAK